MSVLVVVIVVIVVAIFPFKSLAKLESDHHLGAHADNDNITKLVLWVLSSPLSIRFGNGRRGLRRGCHLPAASTMAVSNLPAPASCMFVCWEMHVVLAQSRHVVTGSGARSPRKRLWPCVSGECPAKRQRVPGLPNGGFMSGGDGMLLL